MARTPSLSCLLLLSLSTCVQAQTAVFDEDDVQGLEMLQIKGHVENRNCPMPDVEKYQAVGKDCFQGEAPPGEDDLCLANDQQFQYLEEAWKACGHVPGCGAVVQTPNGEFRLRRASDPDTKDPSSRLYMYDCKADKQEKMMSAHKHDPAKTEFQELEDEDAVDALTEDEASAETQSQELEVDALSEESEESEDTENAMHAEIESHRSEKSKHHSKHSAKSKHHSHAKAKAIDRLQDLDEEDLDVDALAEKHNHL